MPTNKLESISSLFEKYYPISAAQQFLELSGGVKFPHKSMTKLRETVLARKHNVLSDELSAENINSVAE